MEIELSGENQGNLNLERKKNEKLTSAQCYLEILQAVVEEVHQDPGQVLDRLDGVLEHGGGHRGREAVGHVLEQLGDGPGLVRVHV